MRSLAVAAVALALVAATLPAEAREPLPTDDIEYRNGCVVYIPRDTSDMGHRACVHPTNTSCPASVGMLTIAGWINFPCDP